LSFGSDAFEQLQKFRGFLFHRFRGSFLEGYHFGHGSTSPGDTTALQGHLAGNCRISAAQAVAGSEFVIIPASRPKTAKKYQISGIFAGSIQPAARCPEPAFA
jgi:hypothetical protein